MNIDIILGFISEVFEGTDKAHDFEHSYRVYINALNIMSDFQNVNREVVILASLLHDVADPKLFSNQINLDLWFENNPTIYENQIRQVISEVGFSKKKKPSTIESAIVQDADRLDAIGAIGIARVFTYGGHIDRPIFSKNFYSSISHFDEKLFKIKDMLNTQKAIDIAKKRDSYMHEFISVFEDEMEGNR